MKLRRYQLGIIPCTKTKNPVGITPVTLYRSTPFSLMMRHALQRCDQILVLSAKHGFLGLKDHVTFYDASLSDLTREERIALANLTTRQITERGLLEIPFGQIHSYLPNTYHDFLISIEPRLAAWGWAGGMHRPFATSQTLLKALSDEIKAFAAADSVGR